MKGPESGLPELLSKPGPLLPPACRFLGPTSSFLVSPKLALSRPPWASDRIWGLELGRGLSQPVSSGPDQMAEFVFPPQQFLSLSPWSRLPALGQGLLLLLLLQAFAKPDYSEGPWAERAGPSHSLGLDLQTFQHSEGLTRCSF